MKLYKLSNKGLRKEIKEFSKSIYGRTIFLLAYSVPLSCLIFSIIFWFLINYYGSIYYYFTVFPIVIALLFLTFLSFIYYINTKYKSD